MKHVKKLVSSLQPEIDFLNEKIREADAVRTESGGIVNITPETETYKAIRERAIDIRDRALLDIFNFKKRISEVEELIKLNKGASPDDLAEMGPDYKPQV